MKVLFCLVVFAIPALNLNLTNPENPDQYIVGGNDARPEQFPYLVSLRRTVERRHICGGALVNVYWILSVSLGLLDIS